MKRSVFKVVVSTLKHTWMNQENQHYLTNNVIEDHLTLPLKKSNHVLI